MSDPQRTHGLQPTRLLRPWDFPGRSTGVGCHCSTAQKEKRPTDLPPSSSVVDKSDTVSLRQDQGHSRVVFLFRLSRRESISLPFAPSRGLPHSSSFKARNTASLRAESVLTSLFLMLCFYLPVTRLRIFLTTFNSVQLFSHV